MVKIEIFIYRAKRPNLEYMERKMAPIRSYDRIERWSVKKKSDEGVSILKLFKKGSSHNGGCGVKTKTDFGYKARDILSYRIKAIGILSKLLTGKNNEFCKHFPNPNINYYNILSSEVRKIYFKAELFVEKLKYDSRVEDRLLEDLMSIAEKDYSLIIRDLTKSLINKYWIEDLRLYKQNTDGFIKYFSNINDGEKKNILRKILDSDFDNEDVNSWLYKHHSQLVREVGLEP